MDWLGYIFTIVAIVALAAGIRGGEQNGG